jgi:tight adherence protein C
MLTPILFFVFAFLTIGAMIWSGIQLIQVEENPLEDRLADLQSQSTSTAVQFRRRHRGRGFFDRFLFIISHIPGMDDYLNDTEKELAQAGIRNRQALGSFVLGHVAFMVLMIGGMIYLQRGNPFSQKFGGIVAAFLLGWLLPNQILHRLVKRYRAKLQEALPDTVDLLGIVLGTGLALDQAMTRVAEEMQFIYPELANEFYTLVMQVKAGQERQKAFAQMVRRTGLDDIKSLSAMIIQSERFGTSLSTALKVYADALRTRRRLRAEAAVGKAGIKMLFPIVLFILPALFVITLVPGLLSVLRDLKGGIGAR